MESEKNGLGVVKSNKISSEDPGLPDPAEQLEIARRTLILNEMGIDVPRDRLTGELDVEALLRIDVCATQP